PRPDWWRPAEFRGCTRLGSELFVCMQTPPPPGCHLRACSWLLMPGTISHESPPSWLLNSDAGSTPHQSSFLPGPASSDQMLTSARPSSLGNAGADFVSLKLFPLSVERNTFIPKNGFQPEAYRRNGPRGSMSVAYTGTRGPRGPRSVKVRRGFAASATNTPFLVPIVRITRSAIQPPETAGRIVTTSPGVSVVSSPSRSRTLSEFTKTFRFRRSLPVSSQTLRYKANWLRSSDWSASRTVCADSESSVAPAQYGRSGPGTWIVTVGAAATVLDADYRWRPG